MGCRVQKVIGWVACLAVIVAVTAGCSLPSLPQRAGGGVFVVALDSPALTLDPALVTDLSSARVVSQICETLVSYNPESGAFDPQLALSWAVSGDGRVWTFTLRSGVTFHDGTPLNADAVVQNITRWLDTSSPYHRGDFDYWQIIFGGFKGSGSKVRMAERVDDYRFRLTLEEPWSPLLAALSLFPFSIVSPTTMRSDVDSLRRHPVCTGAFRMEQWASDGTVTLAANASYWGGKSALDGVRFVALATETARLNALRSGQVHMAEGSSASEANAARQIPGVKAILRPSRSIVFLSINQKAAPFDDARVRQAMAQAIDRKSIAGTLYGGLAQEADQFVPPTVPGYDHGLDGIVYNRSAARQLLSDAGYGGLMTQLWYPTRARSLLAEPRAMAETIADNLRAVDIVTVINSADAVTYQQRSLDGGLPLYLQSWTGDMPDADSFLTGLFASDTVSRSIGYASLELRTTVASARGEGDSKQRATLYQQIAGLLRNDMPRIPLVYVQTPVLLQRDVNGFAPGALGVESYHKVRLGR